jgi:hypothetical protein
MSGATAAMHAGAGNSMGKYFSSKIGELREVCSFVE